MDTPIKRNTAAAFVAAELARGKVPNPLIREKSPYLLQHAFNPVRWYPWGEEALSRAKQEKKPIFLSIGYSTCHWCHVMERESFEDPEIAARLNRDFIAIKVDREERPDLDRVYMAFLQAMTGGGGWPLSVFLTPDLQPFHAGTYFPPRPRYGHPGFGELLRAIQEAWAADFEVIVRQGAELTEQMAASMALAEPAALLDEEIAARAAHQFMLGYDHVYGGFDGAPKFPRPVAFYFLFRFAARTANNTARTLVLETLRRMAAGGIYDQLGGGFHRYSVDAQWRVPHFEKMLYDQALLAVAYLEAFQVSGEIFFAEIAAGTLDYVLGELREPGGGFYSAEDADSPLPEHPDRKGEGAFYLWKLEEVEALLRPEAAAVFSYYYGLAPSGNALADPHHDFVGKNILYAAHSMAEVAARFAMTPAAAGKALSEARQCLLACRQQRPRPHLDDKVLTSWNGLMISALARAYQVLGKRRYLDGAVGAARFIVEKMYVPQEGILLHRYREGEAGIEGQLDDYAFLVQGLLDLYEAAFEPRWLDLALQLTEKQLLLFADLEKGGFFESTGRDSSVLFRLKGDYDGAEPAANSIAALNLFRLGQMIDGAELVRKAEETVLAFSAQLLDNPTAMPQMLAAYEFILRRPCQIVIAGIPQKEDTLALQRAIASFFLPNKVLMLAGGKKTAGKLAGRMAFLESMPMLAEQATAYICANFACRQPTTSIKELKRILAKELAGPA